MVAKPACPPIAYMNTKSDALILWHTVLPPDGDSPEYGNGGTEHERDLFRP